MMSILILIYNTIRKKQKIFKFSVILLSFNLTLGLQQEQHDGFSQWNRIFISKNKTKIGLKVFQDTSTRISRQPVISHLVFNLSSKFHRTNSANINGSYIGSNIISAQVSGQKNPKYMSQYLLLLIFDIVLTYNKAANDN